MKTLKESILSGKKTSIENTKNSIRFSYDGLVNLITEKSNKLSSEPQYSIHTYDDLNRLFDNDVPNVLQELNLSKRGSDNLQIDFVIKKDSIWISVISTDQATNVYTVRVLKRWLKVGGSRIEDNEDKSNVYFGTTYLNYIKVYKK